MTERLKLAELERRGSPRNSPKSSPSNSALALAQFRMSSPFRSKSRTSSPGGRIDDEGDDGVALEPEIEARIQQRVQARLQALQDLSKGDFLAPSSPLPPAPDKRASAPAPGDTPPPVVCKEAVLPLDENEAKEGAAEVLAGEFEAELSLQDVVPLDDDEDYSDARSPVLAVASDDQFLMHPASNLWPVEQQLPTSPKRVERSEVAPVTPRSPSRARASSPSRRRDMQSSPASLLSCTVFVHEGKRDNNSAGYVHCFYGFVQHDKGLGGRMGSLVWTFSNSFPHPADLPFNSKLGSESNNVPPVKTPATFFSLHLLQEISVGKKESIFGLGAFSDVSDLCCISLISKASQVHLSKFYGCLPGLVSW
jgi:hypothetical protein